MDIKEAIKDIAHVEAIIVTVKNILQQIHDEADHIIGTEAENHKEVAIQDASNIKGMAIEALKLIG